MESRQVRHFVAVCERGTFAAAAAQLGLSQQAVSKSIARLEALLGVRLFERDGRRLRPTAYAELFLPHARAIAAEVERFRTGLDDLLGGRGGTLRLGVGPSAAVDLVARAVGRFSVLHPTVKVRVAAGLFDDMSDDLVLGRLDLFVAVRQVDRPNPLIFEEPIADVRYLVVCGADHPLARRSDVGFADLAAADWIMGTALGDVGRAIDASFAQAGVERPVSAIETSSVLFALSLLRLGRHLMVLPETLIAGEIAAGRLSTVEVAGTAGWTRPLVVACRVNSVRVKGVVALLDAIAAERR